MKLAKEFQIVTVDGREYLTSSVRGFNGQAACNETASFIIRKLKREISRDKLIRAMCRKFDASEETIAKDVDDVLETLRQMGALER